MAGCYLFAAPQHAVLTCCALYAEIFVFLCLVVWDVKFEACFWLLTPVFLDACSRMRVFEVYNGNILDSLCNPL
eukprot:1722081-Rhodomonas_salina.1